jgi:DNA recombination protein RmuC
MAGSTLLYGGLFIVGGVVGLVVGGGLTWILWGQPKAQALADLRTKFETQKVQREADAEKLTWLEKAQAQMREAFEALAGQTLQSNADQFLDRSKSELSHLVNPLDKELDKLNNRIRELEEKRAGAYEGLQAHLKQLGAAQQSLQETTITLKQALKSSGTRGQWGELQLRRVVELAGMVEHVDFEEQFDTGAGRPDLVVRLPNEGYVPVDAKVPMGAYLDAMAAEDPEARQTKLNAHAQAVRSRVRELARKDYPSQFDRSPEFVVMFVPNESCLSAAFECDGALLDDAMALRILIASPVTLLAVLKAVSYGWQQVSIAENAQEIADEGKTLYQRIAKLAEHIESLGTNLDRSVESYNSMIGSLERRLLPSARRFEELGVETTEMPALHSVDENPHSLNAEEMQHYD